MVQLNYVNVIFIVVGVLSFFVGLAFEYLPGIVIGVIFIICGAVCDMSWADEKHESDNGKIIRQR